jgi:hypothetical protein
MRPLRSFLLLLIFLACFTGLHYVISINQYFPSIYEFVPATLINNYLSDNKKVNKSSAGQVTNQTKSVHADTINSVCIVAAATGNLLNRPLQPFLDSLRFSKGQLRIMYYGDSQIEGDRITSYLRQTLRKIHGGSGPGLFLPLMPVMYTKSVWIRSSSNWKRYNYISYKTGEINHRNLGPFMSICRYLPDGMRKSTPEKAIVRITPSNVADSSSSVYDFLRVFYGNTEDKVNVIVKADGNQVYTDTLKKGMGFNEFCCQLKGAKEIVIEFSGNVSPDIYGISIESKTGLIIDNIPQRGSAGLEFTMIGTENLKEAYRKLKPDLFILQYGLNIVKNVREDYSYYHKGLRNSFPFLKRFLRLL